MVLTTFPLARPITCDLSPRTSFSGSWFQPLEWTMGGFSPAEEFPYTSSQRFLFCNSCVIQIYTNVFAVDDNQICKK